MRISMIAALSLICSVPASATSLSGKPFPIDPATDDRQVLSAAFEADRGSFGVVLAEPTNGAFTDAISLLFFDANGRRVGKKALVRSNARDGGRSALSPSGAMPLAEGRTLVGFDMGVPDSVGATGHLNGQMMADGKRSGPAFPIDDVRNRDFYFGYLLKLRSGRGLAYWTSAASLTAPHVTGGRLISETGEPDSAAFDMSRPNSRFFGVSLYRDGFISHYQEANPSFSKLTVAARIYDGSGLDAGREMKIADNQPYGDAVFTQAVGLTDGSIVVIRSVRRNRGVKLFAQRFDDDWKPLGEERVIAKGLIEQEYRAEPLAGGDILIGFKVRDGARDPAIELRRYTSSLEQVGEGARIRSKKEPFPSQLVTFSTGDALMTYTTTGDATKLTGQLIKP